MAAVDVLRRILARANDDSAGPNTLFLFDEALRNERRATVERIRTGILGPDWTWDDDEHRCPKDIAAVLNAEAAR